MQSCSDSTVEILHMVRQKQNNYGYFQKPIKVLDRKMKTYTAQTMKVIFKISSVLKRLNKKSISVPHHDAASRIKWQQSHQVHLWDHFKTALSLISANKM